MRARIRPWPRLSDALHRRRFRRTRKPACGGTRKRPLRGLHEKDGPGPFQRKAAKDAELAKGGVSATRDHESRRGRNRLGGEFFCRGAGGGVPRTGLRKASRDVLLLLRRGKLVGVDGPFALEADVKAIGIRQ